jgi:hypothetical protein
VLSANTRITRSLFSSGGKRTRSAMSMPSAITSTRRGVQAGDHLADLEIQKRRRTTHANDTLRFAARALDQFLRRIGFHQHSEQCR